MPPRHLSNLTILNGQTESGIADLRAAPYQGLTHLVFYAPATLPETVTLHSATDPTAVFGAHQSGGTDITLAAGKRTTVDIRGIGALRLVASAAVAADRVFGLSGAEPEPT